MIIELIPVRRCAPLSLSLAGAVPLALSSSPILPVAAEEDGSAEDLGVVEINRNDAI